MFDIGFSELVLIFVVGLVVLGPQRLPVAIRTVMGWMRTIRGLAHSVQTELSQELKLQELQESIKKAEALNIGNLSPELGKTVEELKQSAQKMQEELNSAQQSVKALSDEQVAEIQRQIEQENQTLESAENTGQAAENDLSHAEIAELAEEELDKLSAYYPPDEIESDHHSPTQDKKDVS